MGDGIPGGAYWTQWQYNPLGDQATETDHSLTGGTSTLTAYTYNNGTGTGTGQPDTLTSAATTGGATGTSAWTYDPDGNTTSASVTAGGSTQDECYDYTPGSELSQAWPATALPCPATPPADSTSTTSYVYDASGNLLAADNPGSDTLYLPGEQITATTDSSGNTAITGIRFIPLPGGGQVVRTGPTTSYQYETTDQHGTSLLTLDRTLQNPAWRQFTPYGAPRGTAPGSWPDTNGYLGDPVNPADNLTTIGARQYNPATGRFLTPDPVLEAGDPNQMGGYAYAGDNPITQSDPTGLTATGPQGSNCSTGTEYLQACGGSGTSDTGTSPGSPTGSPGSPTGSPGSPTGLPACSRATSLSGQPCSDSPATAPTPTTTSDTSWESAALAGLYRAIALQERVGVYYPGCSGRLYVLGACPSEAGVAGTTPQQVEQALIGAGTILASAIPLGDVLDALSLGRAAAEDAGSGAAQTVFRADTRGPDEIFSRGFEPKGGNMNLWEHVTQNPADSGFVSTTKSLSSAQDFAAEIRADYIYRLRATGTDVNATFGADSPFPWENEIAVPGSIPGSSIEGAWGPSGWTDNSFFAP